MNLFQTHLHKLMPADVASDIPTAYNGTVASAVQHLTEMYKGEPKKVVIQDVTIYGWCVDMQIHILGVRQDKVIMFLSMSDEEDSLYDIHDGVKEISWDEDENMKEHLTVTYKNETKILFDWSCGTK